MRSSRLTMGFVLTGTAFGVLVTSACTNVAGLTGYTFDEDASGDAGADARVADGPVGIDAGSCKGLIDAGVGTADPTCVACAESKCCEALAGCSSTVCLLAARTGACKGDRACQKLEMCFGDNCTQCQK